MTPFFLPAQAAKRYDNLVLLLVFGLLLILMMIFRPEGMVPAQRARLELHEAEADAIPDAQIEGDIAPDDKLAD